MLYFQDSFFIHFCQTFDKNQENFSQRLSSLKKTVQRKKNTVSFMQKGRNMKQEFTADRNAGRLDSFLSAETKISRSKIKKYI